MRKAGILLTTFLSAALIFGMGYSSDNLYAENEEEKKITVPVFFKSIRAEIKDYGDDEEDRDRIEYHGDFDRELKRNLEELSKKNGYNYFEIVNSATLAVTSRAYKEYRLVSDSNYYVRNIIKSVKAWKDHEKKEHKFVLMRSLIISRIKKKDEEGKEKVVEKKVGDYRFERETGRYFLLVWLKFFKKKEGEEV